MICYKKIKEMLVLLWKLNISMLKYNTKFDSGMFNIDIESSDHTFFNFFFFYPVLVFLKMS